MVSLAHLIEYNIKHISKQDSFIFEYETYFDFDYMHVLILLCRLEQHVEKEVLTLFLTPDFTILTF